MEPLDQYSGSKMLCQLDGAYFEYFPVINKYRSSISADGEDREFWSRTPEKVWEQYKNGLSVRLMEVCRRDGAAILRAKPVWLSCGWDRSGYAWSIDCPTGELPGKIVRCSSPEDAAGKFFRSLCANMERRFAEFRKEK